LFLFNKPLEEGDVEFLTVDVSPLLSQL